MSLHVDQAPSEAMETIRGYVKAQEHLSAAGDGREASAWVDELRDTEIMAWLDDSYPGGAAQFMEDNGL